MNQPSLFHEDVWQALTDCVRALGGAKRVGCIMRPQLGPEKAGRWLLDCLSPTRDDKLDLEQIIFILTQARDVDCHASMTYLARTCGYADPLPIEPEDEAADLERKFVNAVDTLSEMTKRIAALRAKSRPRTG